MAQSNAKTLSNNRFVFQGLGAEENSQSNAGGGSVWSDHVKRAKIAADAVASEGKLARRTTQSSTKSERGQGFGQGASATSLRTALWAGLAANRFKRSKTK